MITKNSALFKKSLSAIALSLAFQSPYALAMENDQNESALSNAVLPTNALQIIIRKSVLNTKINGWSSTCNELRHFTLGTILDIPSIFMKNITDLHLPLFPNLIGLYLQNNTSISGEALSQLKKVTYLNLSHNSVITNSDLLQFPELTELNLAENNMITNEALSKLKKLTTLILSFNSEVTDSVLLQFPELTKLGLAHNSMITNEALSQLKNLTFLDLGCNPMISEISDDGLSNLTNLRTLILDCNSQITDHALANLTNLTQLNLEFNYKITDGAVSTLSDLQYLGLHGNTKITDLALVKLMNLTQLDLSGNACFPCVDHNSLSKLINLKYLSVSKDAQISHETLGHLTNLIGFKEEEFGSYSDSDYDSYNSDDDSDDSDDSDDIQEIGQIGMEAHGAIHMHPQQIQNHLGITNDIHDYSTKNLMGAIFQNMASRTDKILSYEDAKAIINDAIEIYIPADQQEKARKAVFFKLKGDNQHQEISLVVSFIQQHHPEKMMTWIQGFVEESIIAYKTGDTISCTKGIRERIATGLRTVDAELDQLFAQPEAKMLVKNYISSWYPCVEGWSNKVAKLLVDGGFTSQSTLKDAVDILRKVLEQKVESYGLSIKDYNGEIEAIAGAIGDNFEDIQIAVAQITTNQI